MILFLGAGASKLFGIPDTKGFIEIFDRQPDISQSDIYKEIKEAFGDDTDLEILMTVLEDLRKHRNLLLKSISPQTTDFLFRNINERDYYLDDEKVKTESKELINYIKRVIRAECLKAESDSQVTRILDVYDRFFESFKFLNMLTQKVSGDGQIMYPGGLKIVTTNYDRCIEIYLGKHQIDFAQGIEHRYGYAYFDVSSFEKNGEKVELLKLHGTIDLFNVNGVIRQRRHGEDSGEEVVYYPVEFSGYQHIIESPYLELFYLFRDRINRDSPWVVIGSSLRDRTICSIMNDVIRLKPIGRRPKVIFVNRDVTVIERLRSWGFIHLVDAIGSNRVLKEFGSDETNEDIAKCLQA